MSAVRLEVDMTKCRGSGMCALLFEEAIDLDRFGYPIVTSVPLAGSLHRRAAWTARACPHGALSVVDLEGPGGAR